jgi:hypothetical protein
MPGLSTFLYVLCAFWALGYGESCNLNGNKNVDITFSAHEAFLE